MKTSLPILTLALILPFAVQAPAQTGRADPAAAIDATTRQTRGNGRSAQPDHVSKPAAPGAQELVAKAAEAVFRQRSISASIRQSVDLFGHRLVGSGSYLQLGEGSDKLLRLELKMQVGDHVTSLQQVCDGDFLWIRRTLPSGARLGRVDLRRVRKEMARSRDVPQVASASNWLGLGGLPKLLTGLNENFQFTRVQQGQLGQWPVWVIRGQWKPERLAQLLPDQKEAILSGKRIDFSELPEHLPERVTVVLARDETLFPFRIEFLRQRTEEDAAADPSKETKPPTPIVVMELFEVQLGAPIDPLRFVYKPDELELADHTEQHLKRIGLGADQ